LNAKNAKYCEFAEVGTRRHQTSTGRVPDYGKGLTQVVPHPLETFIFVYFDSVRHAIAFAVRRCSENASIGQRPVRLPVINANVSFLAVIYIETLSIGREDQPIGLGQIPCGPMITSLGLLKRFP